VVFRSQEYRHGCSLCERRADSACPRCQRAICSVHRTEPEGCCDGCLTDLYLESSRAGRSAFTAGSVLGGISVAALYIMSQLQVLPPFALGAALAGIAGSLGAVLYGGVVAPRLVRRAQLRQLRHTLALPSASPREDSEPEESR